MLTLTTYQLDLLRNDRISEAQALKMSAKNEKKLVRKEKQNRRKRIRVGKYQSPNLKLITELYTPPLVIGDTPAGFYRTEEWRRLRRIAILVYGNRCLRCKRVPPGRDLHIDHIWPSSSSPEKRLLLTNTQPLCKQCNMWKSAQYLDFRSDEMAAAARAIQNT